MKTGPSLSELYRALRTAGLLSVGGGAALLRAIARTGLNLASLVHAAANRFGDRPALADPTTCIGFRQLARETDRIAAALRDHHGIGPGSRVGILCRNGAPFIRALFAAARAGADIYLLNVDLGAPQLREIATRHRLGLIVSDEESADRLEGGPIPLVTIASVMAMASLAYAKLRRCRGGQLVVLTGGTTGPPKAAARRPAPARFLALFLDLVATLQLERRKALFVAVPLSHGYGVASAFVALALGRTLHLMPRFRSDEACRLIQRHRIDAIAVVPTMLQRMLAEEEKGQGERALGSLRLIISGGAALPPRLAAQARERYGDVLFNLYGSSEAGLIAIATPADLADAPDTVGRPFWRVTIALHDDAGRPVGAGEAGRVIVRGSASAGEGPLDTGDIAYRDSRGRLFIRGRGDDMISSGGEKVHPWEVESVILGHSGVAEVAVVGVDDPEFGQRLVAFVVPVEKDALTPPALAAWLAGRLGRFQQPRDIVLLGNLPLTAAGKPDKRSLRATLAAVD